MGDFFLVLIIGRLRVPVPTGYGTDLNIGRLKVPVIQRWVPCMRIAKNPYRGTMRIAIFFCTVFWNIRSNRT